MKPFGVVTTAGKVVNTDILSQYAVKQGEDSRALPPDTFVDFYSAKGLVQPLYNPEALARALEINTYHYRACKTKARDVGGLGWDLHPSKDNPSDSDYELVKAFFEGQETPITTLFTLVSLDKESIGYGALELVKEDYKPDGYPVYLKHIPSHTLRRHSDQVRVCQIRGSRTRWFKMAGAPYDVHYETGRKESLGTLPPEQRATEIIWVVNYTPRSDYYGIPDVIPALPAVYGEASRENYNIGFFDNHGVPSYAVFITGNFDPGELDEEGRSELEKAIEEHFKKLSNNPHSTLILSIPTRGREDEVKVTFQPLGTEVKDASFRLFRKDNTEEILSAHAVPPYRAGIAKEGSLGGNTAKESTEIYKRSVIEPRQEELETLITRHVIKEGFGVEDWKFKLAPIDLQDEKQDLSILSQLFRMGAVTPNQIIRQFKDRFGLEESDDPLMDKYYIDGQPVDDFDKEEETEQAMLALETKLLEVAEKNAGSGHGFGDPYGFKGIAGGKERPQKTKGRGEETAKETG